MKRVVTNPPRLPPDHDSSPDNQVNGERAFRSLAGQDEFSAGGKKKKRKPLMEIKPARREVPAFREGEKPLEVVESAFMRRMGKILKGK